MSLRRITNRMPRRVTFSTSSKTSSSPSYGDSSCLGWWDPTDSTKRTVSAGASISADLTGWFVANVTNAGGQADPDSGSNAYLIDEDVGGTPHWTYKAASGAQASSWARFTGWVAKGAGSDTDYVRVRASGYGYLDINVATGEVWNSYLGSYKYLVSDGAGWWFDFVTANLGGFYAYYLQSSPGVDSTGSGDAKAVVYQTALSQTIISQLTDLSANGFDAAQATATAQPWFESGEDGHVIWDGFFPSTTGQPSDVLTTSLPPPSTSGSMLCWIRRSNYLSYTVSVAMGASVDTAYCYLGIDADNCVMAGIGSDSYTTITGGALHFDWTLIAVTWGTAGVKLYTADATGITEEYSGALNGTVPTGQPIYLGAENDDGTAARFFCGETGKCAVFSRQLAESEIAAYAVDHQPTRSAPRLSFPAIVSVVSGQTLRVQENTIALLPTASSVSGQLAASYSAGVWYIPTSTTASYSETFQASRGASSESSSVTISCVDALAGGADTRNILVVGDSLTAAETYLGVIATALGAKCNFVGLRGVTYNHEGVSGATFAWHATNASSSFTNLGAIDIANFLTTLGSNPDIIVWFLGQNDVFASTPHIVDTSIQTAFGHFESLRVAFDAQLPAVKHALLMMPPGNSRQSAFEDDYPGSTGADKWRYRYKAHRWNEKLVSVYDGRSAERIWVVPSHCSIDQTEGYPSDNAIHPNTAGYTSIATILQWWLEANWT